MITSDSRIPPALRDQLIDLYRRALEEGVPIDVLEDKITHYLERLEVTNSFEARDESAREQRLKKQVPKAIRYGAIALPLIFLSIGMYLVGSAVVPILAYYVQTAPGLSSSTALIAPIPQEDVMENTPLVVSKIAGAASGQEKVTSPTIVNEQLDFTNLNNWFEFNSTALPELAGSEQSSTEYTIDIPSLNIKNALVQVGGTDLNKSLIQYPGTAGPGDKGAPVIFGHSVLRQFYNPNERNPQRYNSIFSTIMTLKPGDPIYITQDGVKYTYVVQEKFEVKPDQVEVLNQDYSAKRLKLITCVPEGTYLRRGVIVAQLVE